VTVDRRGPGPGAGLIFGTALLLLSVTLKTTGVVAWSWWLVMMPLWVAIAVLVTAGTIILALVASDNRERRRARAARSRQP
jgi:Flp pilus assembly protein TadB